MQTHQTVDLDTLTPRSYAQLPRAIQACVPDRILARLRLDLELEFFDAEAARRQAEAEAVQADPATTQALKALMGAEVSGDSPIRIIRRENPRHTLSANPSKPCPHARHLGLRTPHGALRTVSVPCRRRSCPVCGPHWAALRAEGTRYRVEEHHGRFEVITVRREHRAKFDKAMERFRKRGGRTDGIRIPVDLDGTHLVVLARHEDGEICRSLPAVPVDDAAGFIEMALQGAVGAAIEWDDIPAEHRPGKLGNVAGIGSWHGAITPNLPEPPESNGTVEVEFVELPPRDELIRMATAAGLYARKLPGNGLELIEPPHAPGAEKRFLGQLVTLDLDAPDPF